jgi:hypothetical protein
MPNDFDVIRRLEAIEAALGLRARRPILSCDECGVELPKAGRLTESDACPRCERFALYKSRIDWWPPRHGG